MVLGRTWDIVGFYARKLDMRVLDIVRYCDYNFYFVGSTSEYNLDVIRVIPWHYVSDSILFVSNKFIRPEWMGDERVHCSSR